MGRESRQSSRRTRSRACAGVCERICGGTCSGICKGIRSGLAAELAAGSAAGPAPCLRLIASGTFAYPAAEALLSSGCPSHRKRRELPLSLRFSMLTSPLGAALRRCAGAGLPEARWVRGRGTTRIPGFAAAASAPIPTVGGGCLCDAVRCCGEGMDECEEGGLHGGWRSRVA